MVIPGRDGLLASDYGCLYVLSHILTFVLIMFILITLLLEWVTIWPLKTPLPRLFPLIIHYCPSFHEFSQAILFLLSICLRDGFLLSMLEHLMIDSPLYHI